MTSENLVVLKVSSPTQGMQLDLRPHDPPLSIGRSADCGVKFTNRLVSSNHARLVYRDDSWVFEDVGSTNGSFLNGRSVSSQVIDAACEVLLGDPNSGEVLKFDLTEKDGESAATSPGRVKAATVADQPDQQTVFAAQALTVETNGVRRLDRVSFALPRGVMLGVLGGSGAGKTTLVKAITGSGPATSGRVLFDGYDLYENFDLLRRRLGYVPQDDILHTTLTVSETLRYAARLRMPDATQAEREERSAEVLGELGLSHRSDARVSELSGGQRKRLNVAIELLARPPLLLLDEPTSGLDPANERSLMVLLRGLADGGRTIIVVTHNTESLHLVDDVLVLARGGVPVFLGAADEFAETFDQPSLIDAFAYVDSHPAPDSLRDTFDDEQRGANELHPTAVAQVPPPRSWTQRLSDASAESGRDTWTLLQRSVQILRGDQRNAAFIAAQAPLIAVVLVALFHGNLLRVDDPAEPKPKGASLLLALVLGVIFIGAANTVREIVKERAVMLREQAVGVSTMSYFASKTIMWGAIVLVQSAVIVLVVTMFNGGPNSGLISLGPVNETLWVVALSGIVAVCSGLLMSSMVTTTDKAMTMLPIYLFLQLLLAGMIVPVHKFPMRVLSWFVSSKWGLDGVAAIGQMDKLRAECFTEPDECSANWSHKPGNLLLALAMLTVFVIVTSMWTYRNLKRSDPSRVLARRKVGT